MLTDRRTDGRTEPRIYTLLPLIVEYNKLYDKNFLSYRITTSFWVIASQTKMLTNRRTDRQTRSCADCGPRIYTLLSLIVEYNCAKFQNCTIKTFWVIASQLKWLIASRREMTDGQTDNVITIGGPEPRIYTFLPLIVEYNCAKFQICMIKTFWVIASQLRLSHHDENVDGRTNGRATEPRIYTVLPLIVEYNCAKFQICTLKTVLVIASQLQLLHQDENVDGQTNGRADGTQNLYTSASYCLVQLCKVSKLYDKNFLSYRIKTKMLTDRRTDGRTEPRIYTLLPLIV